VTIASKYFGQLEKYVSQFFEGGLNLNISKAHFGLIIEDIDYTKFKLFQLSILWRAGISKDKHFSEIEL